MDIGVTRDLAHLARARGPEGEKKVRKREKKRRKEEKIGKGRKRRKGEGERGGYDTYHLTWP